MNPLCHRSFQSHRRAVRRPVRQALAALGLLATLAGPAAAQSDPSDDPPAWRRHGSVARLLWTPGGMDVRLPGGQLSAGLVLGTRGKVRTALGPVAPALVFGAGERSNITLMVVGSRGAMLVWQRRD